jgi:L-rhamnose isomerase / sugar isomerase
MTATALSAIERVAPAVSQLEIETPSWGYGNSGTRFKVFPQPGVPRTPFEKIEDAATVARFTGVAKSIALHIPWDRVDDFSMLAAFARERGIAIGGINSNTFQDEDYKLGSLCHPSLAVRRKAVAHVLECCEIASQTGSRVVKVWLGDGTNYPGQDDFRARRRHLIESLQEAYPALPGGARLFLEYKLYEPAFYHTDVQDWGQALSVCQHVGERAQVCVDTGHHSLGVNIEQIVAYLLQEGRLGGFDLNDKKYGDDDLMVGSIDPYQLFRICHELVKALADTDDATARACAEQTVYMLDQSHNIEPKLPAVVRSVMNLQEAFAKALLVDQPALSAAQSAGEVLEANAIMKDAFDTDVRPLLAEARAAAGLPGDPYRAFLASGELDRRVDERVGGVAMGWQ